MEKTTDLRAVQVDPDRFLWGKVIKFHNIGPYTVIEALHGNDLMGSPILFHPYVDGRDTGESYPTFETALIVAIAHKHVADRADRAIMAGAACKLLGLSVTK